MSAQTLIRLGGEFQVNAYTAVWQTHPVVSADSDGDFVIVWSSLYQDGSLYGVFARRLDAAGILQAAEFRVNLRTTGSQEAPSVASGAGGDFVVVWQSGEQDGSGSGIFGRRFNASAVAQASEFQVNSTTQNGQTYPAVDTAPGGGFVVAWEIPSDGSLLGIGARRFNSLGAPLATEFQVNTFTTGNQSSPAIAVSTTGAFVVTWDSTGQDGSNKGIFARRFDAAGTAQAFEFQVNSFTASYQRDPSIASSDAGFVIAWRSFGQDGSQYGIFARRLDAAGVPQGPELRANDFTADQQDHPSVAAESDGDFVITWESYLQGAIIARRFDAAGVKQATEFQVNTYATGTQLNAAAVASADGKFVVAWDSIGQDGDSHGVFAQRFAAPAPLDFDGDGSTDALTDGLLFLRYLFGFTGSTLTSGAVGPGCTRCSAAPIESYAAGTVAKQALALGGEFQINVHTPYSQVEPAIALDSVGGFVVVWRSQFQDGDDGGVFARRFDATGSAQAAEFQINASILDTQRDPSVASYSGGFVVSWSKFASPPDLDVFARRFDSGGTAQSTDFKVNVYTSSFQGYAQVAIDGDGDFVVAWSSNYQDGSGAGVFARRFDATGMAQGLEFQVNAATSGNQFYPALARATNGDFVVTWISNDFSNPNREVFGRRFDALGNPQSALEFLVNTYVASHQHHADIAIDGNGAFVVVWQSQDQDGSLDGIFGQRFSSAGTGQGAEFQVNSITTDTQRAPAVARNSNGAFVVVWLGREGNTYGIFGRTFDSAGAAHGPEFRVSTYPVPVSLTVADVTLDDNGGFVVVWDRYGDGFDEGVFGRRFARLASLDVDGDGTATALTDGLLVLRYLFGFTGSALISGAVGAQCTRCTAAAVEAYLQSLD